MTTDTPTFQIPLHVLHREVDGEMVLLNLETESYFGLDPIGADIVARVTELPLDAALEALIATYAVEPEVLRRDVGDLVASLLDAGLIERAEDPG